MMLDEELDVDETSTINARINTKWHTSLQTRHMQEWFKKAYEAQDDGDSSALLRWRINVGELVESRIAHVVLMLVVVANAAAIGFQTDWVQTRRLDDGGACGVINTLCLVVFTIEVVAKLFACGAIPERFTRQAGVPPDTPGTTSAAPMANPRPTRATVSAVVGGS
mgnify:CR=1 FL=1